LARRLVVAASLKAKCKACGKKFWAEADAYRAAFEAGAMMTTVGYKCPHCGESGTYDKGDFSYEKVPEP
jgi:DNA-directed RNA polymerase subunit RPC12/RpoP